MRGEDDGNTTSSIRFFQAWMGAGRGSWQFLAKLYKAEDGAVQLVHYPRWFVFTPFLCMEYMPWLCSIQLYFVKVGFRVGTELERR